MVRLGFDFLKFILISIFYHSLYVPIVEERSSNMTRQPGTAFVCNVERSLKKTLSSMK